MSEFRDVNTDFLLSAVKRARDAGEPERARREWEACIVRATARVRAVVVAYRTVNGDRISPADHDAVVNQALERGCRRLVWNLETFLAPVFFAAMAQVADYECRDHIRRLGARERGLRGSLDEPEREHDLYEEAVRRDEETRAAFETAGVLDDAIGRLSSTRQRRAIEMRRLGHSYDEIAAELDVTVDNAYQLVCRGLRALRGLMEP